MKKALSLVLALVMMLALTVPAFAVSNTQWKAMKALADWQSWHFIYRATGSGGLGEVLVKNYGYQDRADDYGISGVTRAHVLAALKDLYPVLSDKAAESLLNEPFNSGVRVDGCGALGAFVLTYRSSDGRTERRASICASVPMVMRRRSPVRGPLK